MLSRPGSTVRVRLWARFVLRMVRVMVRCRVWFLLALVAVPALTKMVLAMILGVRCRTLTRTQLFTESFMNIVG